MFIKWSTMSGQLLRGRIMSSCLAAQQIALRRWMSSEAGEDGFLKQVPGYATTTIHVHQSTEKWMSNAVVPPITMSSTFKYKTSGGEFHPTTYEYGRLGNPVRDSLEECMASLECGTHGFTFSSGLGAITAVFTLLSKGDHIISMEEVYGGTFLLLRDIIKRMGVEVTFVDVTNPEKLEKAIKKNTKMLFLETPTNPSIKVVDIQATAKMVKKHGDIIFVVDNTFLTSYFQRPLDYGADIVVYSITKYINGHSDIIMGGAITISPGLADRLRFIQRIMGNIPSPFDCYMVFRSLKTLAIRMEQHKKNALAMAKYLEGHPNIEQVLHPGVNMSAKAESKDSLILDKVQRSKLANFRNLVQCDGVIMSDKRRGLKSYKYHDISKRQTMGHSGIFSFIHRGDLEASKKLLAAFKVIIVAVSLGGYESLAEIPYTMTHRLVPEDMRKELGITPNLIRLSVGIEDCNDLICDMDQALKAAFSK